MGKGDRPRPAKKIPPKGIPELRSVGGSKHRHERDKKGRFTQPQEDPREVALAARARHLGKDIPKERKAAQEQRQHVAAPWLGDPLGMVLERMLGTDTAELTRLWGVWKGYTSSMRTYRKRILGQTGDPAYAHILRVSASPHLDPDEREDIRTDDEKDADAIASWRAWRGRLDGLQAVDRVYLVQAESGMGKPLWEGKAPTMTGMLTARALQRLADLMEMER